MQRWELIGDGSAKFWEAAVEGACVSVRYGRIGTEGRTQAKELDSAAAAEAHFGKLVAGKERKGYLVVGLPGDPADGSVSRTELADLQADGLVPVAPEVRGLADEDTFVVPGSWRRILQPRRGGVPRAAAAPDPSSSPSSWPEYRHRTHSTQSHSRSSSTSSAHQAQALAASESAYDPALSMLHCT